MSQTIYYLMSWMIHSCVYLTGAHWNPTECKWQASGRPTHTVQPLCQAKIYREKYHETRSKPPRGLIQRSLPQKRLTLRGFTQKNLTQRSFPAFSMLISSTICLAGGGVCVCVTSHLDFIRASNEPEPDPANWQIHTLREEVCLSDSICYWCQITCNNKSNMLY